MIETLLGGLLGGAFRLAPEILKWIDRNGERAHELSMQDKALEFEKLRGSQRMAEIGASADAAWNTGAIEALRDAVRSSGFTQRIDVVSQVLHLVQLQFRCGDLGAVVLRRRRLFHLVLADANLDR
jgi:hypothetical protein